MLGTNLAVLFTRPWARRIIGAALAALTVALFLFNLRRAGERAGRLTKRLETTESANELQRQMMKKRLGVLAVAMISLNGCATGSSERRAIGVCPPVVEYGREEQQLLAKEIKALPEDSVIVGWLTDYAVLRAQLEHRR